MSQGEQWRDVPGWRDLYQVSNQGRVFSIRSGRILKGTRGPHGYAVVMCHASRVQGFTIPRLVLQTFAPDPWQLSLVVGFHNDDRYDARLVNLYWKPRFAITPWAAVEIRRRWMAGESGAALSRAFHVSECSISNIISENTWKEAK